MDRMSLFLISKFVYFKIDLIRFKIKVTCFQEGVNFIDRTLLFSRLWEAFHRSKFVV